MKILQVSAHYVPNVGGVETHLHDVVSFLEKKQQQVFVLTYRPLTTKAPWKLFEKKPLVTILRLPWIPGLFYALVHHPILEFLYLLPGLFLVTPFVLFFWNPKVIHTHGLVAGAVSVFWAKLFRKRIVISLHSVYHFPETGLYRAFVTGLFTHADRVLTLSQQSASEVIALGVPKEKVTVFTYWLDFTIFKRIPDAKEKLKLGKKFIVLFVGRLVEEKGIIPLLEAAEMWDKNICLVIAGTGPLEERIKNHESKIKNLKFVGKISNDQLPLYYSAADVLIVPSIHEEGFGRVILESLACGTPVVAANRGGIKEALNTKVGYFITITPESIRNCIESLYNDQKALKEKSIYAYAYAKKHFSEENANAILNTYE
jgi:glycosyltransferase involved in cell wall biosynthesis